MVMSKADDDEAPIKVRIGNPTQHKKQNRTDTAARNDTGYNKLRTLKFSIHMSTVCRSTSRRIGVFMRLTKFMLTEAKLHIYRLAVLPYFQYCSLIWYFYRASERYKLERVNERGVRAAFCDWRSTHKKLHRRAKLTSLF